MSEVTFDPTRDRHLRERTRSCRFDLVVPGGVAGHDHQKSRLTEPEPASQPLEASLSLVVPISGASGSPVGAVVHSNGVNPIPPPLLRIRMQRCRITDCSAENGCVVRCHFSNARRLTRSWSRIRRSRGNIDTIDFTAKPLKMRWVARSCPRNSKRPLAATLDAKPSIQSPLPCLVTSRPHAPVISASRRVSGGNQGGSCRHGQTLGRRGETRFQGFWEFQAEQRDHLPPPPRNDEAPRDGVLL